MSSSMERWYQTGGYWTLRGSQGRITTPFKNLDWLETARQDELYLLEENQVKFRPHLYKMFLFDALAQGIRSGTVNFFHSYRFLDEYLIEKNE